MYFGESLRFTLQALRANKFRTFLTGLGLVIGNASVILVVTISITSRDYILDQIRGVGSNLIYAQYTAGTNTATSVDADFIKMADVDAVRRQFGATHCRGHRRDEQWRPPAGRLEKSKMYRWSAPISIIQSFETWCCFPGISSTIAM